MAAKHSRHIAFTAPILREVEVHVAEGRYASVSDMVRAALRLLLDAEEAKVVGRTVSMSKDRQAAS